MCDNCQKGHNPDGYSILEYSSDSSFREYLLCSLSCLVEFAWKLREKQEKLSKSNVDRS